MEAYANTQKSIYSVEKLKSEGYLRVRIYYGYSHSIVAGGLEDMS